MLCLNKQECLDINDTILLMNTISNCDEMRTKILEQLNNLIPYDKADFFLSNYKKNKYHQLCNPISIGVEEKYLRNYEEYYEQKDYVRWVFGCKESIVYRETDLIDNNVRVKTEFFNDYLIPMGVYYPMGLSIYSNKNFLGTITLFRTKESGDFSEKDMFILELLNSHLSNRLSKELVQSKGLKVHFNEEYGLTKREQEIIKLICEGKSNQEIGALLFVSLSTVKCHVYNIYNKLKVSSRTQLVNKIIS